jgi:hypothetical protein
MVLVVAGVLAGAAAGAKSSGGVGGPALGAESGVLQAEPRVAKATMRWRMLKNDLANLRAPS